MHDLIRETGSLNHLLAFEVAARRGSFTLAAQELGISQPAVSQAVRGLEAALGTRLFDRNHRSIALTDAGERLYTDVHDGFARILLSIQRLRPQQTGRHVTLSVSSAFANYWMVPRLQRFRQTHPGVDLRLQQTDKDLDLAQEGISLGIWRGTGAWKGYDSHLIAGESVVAVASPAWIDANPPVRTIDDLIAAQRITLEEPYRQRPSWPEFFAAFGVTWRDGGGGLRLNDYAVVLQAALAGQGIAFGWEHLTDPLVAAGLLAPVGPWRWQSQAGFYLVWSARADLSEDARAFRDWVIADVAAGVQPPRPAPA
jgi:DNA-binding transcriptional LysR family regulator